MSERGNPSVPSMFISVFLIGGLILGLYAIGQFFYGNEPEKRNVDFACVALDARKAVDWPLYTPQSVPEGWTSNFASFEPGNEAVWRMGIITENDKYLGLEQNALPVQDALEKYAPNSKQTGTVEITGNAWDVYEDGNGTTSYIRVEQDRVVLVVSTTEESVARAYIASLGTADVGCN